MEARKLNYQIVGPGGYSQVFDYVSKPQIQTWVNHILARKNQWKHYPGRLRHDHVEMYSYGLAWYIEIENGDLHAYHAKAPMVNKLISEIPGYLDAMTGIAKFLQPPNGEVVLPVRARRENLGPYWCDSGLHIFGSDDPKAYAENSELSYEANVIHCDYEGLSPYPEALFSAATCAYSAIVSVANPSSGGGLEVWTNKRYLGSELDAHKTLRHADSIKLKYEPGSLTIIDSFLYHNILKSSTTLMNPWRISAVMHFLYREKPYPHWEYWF